MSLLELAVVDDHRSDLDRGAGQVEHRPRADDRDRLVEVGDVEHAESSDDLLRLGEGATTTGPFDPALTVVAVETGCSSAPPSEIFASLSANHW